MNGYRRCDVSGAGADEGVAARRTALEALARVEDDGAYANLVLARSSTAPVWGA